MTADVHSLTALELVGLHTSEKAKGQTMMKVGSTGNYWGACTYSQPSKEVRSCAGVGRIRVQWSHCYLLGGVRASHMSRTLLGHDC